MKRILALILILPALALAQGRFGHGGTTASQMLPIITDAIADSSRWTAGSHIHAIKPRGGKSVQADSAKIGYLNVTGDTQLDGNLTMNTVASESLKVLKGGIRNEGTLRQKGASVFGATPTPVYITADGKIGLNTNSAPYNMLGLASSSSGRGTGIGLTSSQWNKNRTSWGTAQDTSSIGLYIDSAGGPRFSMRAVDGDSLGITLDGTENKITSNTTFGIYVGSNTRLYATASDTQFPNILPLATDTYSFGSATRKTQNYWGSDNIYLGGKGQTATMTWGQQAVMTEQTDSTGVLTMRNGNPLIKLFSGLGNQLNFCGQRSATYDADAWDMWFSTGGSTGTDTLWISIDGTNAAPIVFGARAAKH